MTESGGRRRGAYGFELIDLASTLRARAHCCRLGSFSGKLVAIPEYAQTKA